ncbi:MAG: ParB/RepB/Spo0J family partition protein [Phycisphaeraceae bacterium]|nr:ParB/RepB/Spo0J family partition protein [Phycisphaeraceae bacterium]
MNGRIEQVRVADLVCLPQVRERSGFGDEELAGLAQSIREAGVLQPLLVRRDGDRLVVVDGERRLRAARLAGLDAVPVIIEDAALAEGQVLHRQLVIDAQRVGLSPMERASAIQRLMQATDWTAREVAVKLGISPAQVSKLLALTVLPADVQDAVAGGRMAMSAAYELARIADSDERERLASEVLSGALTRDALALKARETSGARTAAKARRKPAPRERVLIRLGEGRSVSVSAPSLSVDGIASWLTELAHQVRDAGADGRPLSEVVAAVSVKAK